MSLDISNGLNSALQSGFQGFQRASAGVSEATSNIAASAKQQTAQDLTTDLVSLSQNSLNAQASAKVIETSNQTLGTLIDELA